MRFETTGWTEHGEWQASGTILPAVWAPGRPLAVKARLTVTEAHIASLGAEHNLAVDGLIVLVTAERTFDADGRFHQANDERMSTLLTPTGLAIEGGIQGACTNRFGYDWRTPVDLYNSVPLASTISEGGSRRADFELSTVLPADLPPGIYRLRLDFGFSSKNRLVSLNGDVFTYRPFFSGRPAESHLYTALIPASGTHVSGRRVDGLAPEAAPVLGDPGRLQLQRLPRRRWPRRTRPFFAISNRNLIPDDVILPAYDDNGTDLLLARTAVSDRISSRTAVQHPLGSRRAAKITIVVTSPDGKSRISAGVALRRRRAGSGRPPGRSAITAWKPPAYGLYTVACTGWIADIWGNRYDGGGTYHFWIAKRMTLATATFQGMPYPVGGRYGRDIGFDPARPGGCRGRSPSLLRRTPTRANAITSRIKGKATPGGIFGSAQGMLSRCPSPRPANTPPMILATYTDPDGHLWVCDACATRGRLSRRRDDRRPTARSSRSGRNTSTGARPTSKATSSPGRTTASSQHITFPYHRGRRPAHRQRTAEAPTRSNRS